MCQLAKPSCMASSLACVSSIVSQSPYSCACCSGVCACSFVITCLNAVGEIDKQVLPLDDAWYVEYNWGWNSEPHYMLINKLKGVKQPITREQAQTSEDIERDWHYKTIDDTQARELAIQLGLAS